MKKSRIKKLRHQSRTHSIKEGIFASAKRSFGDSYISPFAIAINASNSVVALLSSVSGLLGPLSQLFGSKFIEKSSRKKIMLRAVGLEILTWLPLIAIAFLFFKGILTSALPLLLLLTFAIYIIVSNLGHPAWFSWMGDIVNRKKRGVFFSKRNFILGFVTVVLAIVASFFLDYFKIRGWTMYGFMVLFGLAIVMDIFRWKSFKQQYEPKIKLKKEYYFSFWQFIKNAPKNNFGKFSIYRLFLTLSTTISGPLLAVYLLRHLGFKYSTYMIVILAGTALSLIVLQLLGKFADRYGNYKLVEISSIIIIFIPILWILNPSPIYLVLVPAALNGIAWAGLHLSEGNFIYDNISPQKRGLAISYYNMFWGIGVFVGAGISAFLIKYLKTDFIEPLFAIFILGALARAIVVAFGIRKMREIRHKRKFRGIESIENLIFKEAKPTIHEEFHEIMHIGKYLKAE